MRIAKSTLIGTAVAVALFGSAAFAQQSAEAQGTGEASSSSPPVLKEIVVTGIRYSVKASLAAKRAATNVVEVATATDIGKLPDKNVADVLQRLPGVNTQSAASGEGGFDENNRVSIRGTPASLTQTTIDGHAVATGDWFLLDQFQTVGRSVSYDLLPSEMVSRTVVYKSQSANMIEGGVAGSVDIETPHPLDFKRGFTGSATGGAVYSDLPGKVDPQANVLLDWNDGSLGVLAMGFYEKRTVRRDGQEFLGYSNVSAATAAAWQAANPALPNATGAAYPTLLGEALFQQTRKREGGLVDFQARPSDALSIDLSAFYSHMDADNVNDNFMMWGSNFVSPTYVPTSITVQNGTLVAGTWPTMAGAPASVVYDQITRPGAASETSFINLDATLDVTDSLRLDGQLGYTYGLGKTPQAPSEEMEGGNGVSYQMNGLNSLATVKFPGLDTASPAQFFTDWFFGDLEHTIDKETYGKLDGTLKVDDGAFQSVQFGVRFAHHEREVAFPEDQGCANGCAGVTAPEYSGGEYPSGYQSGLPGGGVWANNIFTFSESAIQTFGQTWLSHGPSRYYWQGAFDVRENDLAAYLMANVGGDHWSANFGVRMVNTLEEVLTNVAGGLHPITFSAFGPFTPTEVDNRYFDVLPSANLKFDLTHDLLLHFSAAETMARPDYSALGGSVSLTDLNLTGNGGNPDLQPVKGAVYSTDVEYYYGPESMVEAGLYDMDLSSYIDFGVSNQTYVDQLLSKGSSTPVYATYAITSPFNTTAEIKGAELAWTQALPLGFGVNANFTLADGEAGDGSPVVGDSKYTYNVGGYYQRGPFSANLDYTYRSHYLVGLDRSSLENEADWRNLDAALTYRFNRSLSLTLNALNLTDETIKYYAANESQPRAFYDNGRQYYFTATYKFR